MSNQDHAKDRAEARRRNRVAAKERAEQEALGITPEAPAAATASAATPPATGGLGFRVALRSSAGRAPIREDLAYLPTLVRTRAFLLPLLLLVVTTVIALQPGILTSNIAQVVVQQIVSPPAFFAVFIAGMMTRRGAWMIGGLFGAFAYVASAIIGSSDVISVLADGNPVKDSFKAVAENLGNPAAMFSDIYGAAAGGILAGAFAGWYSRFLRAMSPKQPTERDRRRMEAERRKGKR
jgi:hypothetical protein